MEITPTRRPPSRTGTPEIRLSRRTSFNCAIDVSGETVMISFFMTRSMGNSYISSWIFVNFGTCDNAEPRHEMLRSVSWERGHQACLIKATTHLVHPVSRSDKRDT